MTRNDTIASLAVNSWINRGRVMCPGADLIGANLSGADLRGCDLYVADLRGADLHGADLRGARITLGNRAFTLTGETAR